MRREKIGITSASSEIEELTESIVGDIPDCGTTNRDLSREEWKSVETAIFDDFMVLIMGEFMLISKCVYVG